MTTISFIGGGNMGYALAVGLQKARPDDLLMVAEPVAAQRERFIAEGIQTSSSNIEITQKADVVVLAVKPQVVEAVATELQNEIKQQLIISIVAGTPLIKLNQWLGETTAIVRCMPNTPALIGAGITGIIANERVSAKQRILVNTILSVCGELVWFESDDDIDKVTALSGSGPAYFFYVIEALIVAGEELGIPHDVATRLAIQTANGASAMVSQGDRDPTTLRENVTSPGGTTEAALQCLNRRYVADGLIAAVQVAYRRAKDLAQ